MRGGKGSGASPISGLGGNKSLPGLGGKYPPPASGGNKLPLLLSSMLLLLLLLFFWPGLLYRLVYQDVSVSRILFPGTPGKDFIKSLSVCFFFKSASLIKDPTIGFSASDVEKSSKTSSKWF